jgi:carbon monoxide dehydrogenase subunit G
MRHVLASVVWGFASVVASPATAEVTASNESGFVSHNVVEVPAAPDEVWQVMLQPERWWNGEHTYSGDARNLSIVPVAGGCFCEFIPGTGAGGLGGAIEHMRVVYVAPNSTLRLNGGLGPLQSEAVIGVLTMTLEPVGQTTRITWDFVVGGYARRSMTELAPVVDRVVGEQLTRLAVTLARP